MPTSQDAPPPFSQLNYIYKMSMYTIFSSNKALQSVSPVTKNEDASRQVDYVGHSPPRPRQASPFGPDYDDDDNDYIFSQMEQRRLSLTDLQNKAIYAVGTRLSVITEASKEE